LIRYGWEILFFRSFYNTYVELIAEVKTLRQKDPDGFKTHPKTKLLASIQKAIKEDVPANPLDKKFMLGNTLSKKYKEWRRVKHGLPPRYRMFFRFRSQNKNIIFAWLNHEGCLRKSGDRNDVYSVFKKMLDNGEIPRNYKDLITYTNRLPD